MARTASLPLLRLAWTSFSQAEKEDFITGMSNLTFASAALLSVLHRLSHTSNHLVERALHGHLQHVRMTRSLGLILPVQLDGKKVLSGIFCALSQGCTFEVQLSCMHDVPDQCRGCYTSENLWKHCVTNHSVSTSLRELLTVSHLPSIR